MGEAVVAVETGAAVVAATGAAGDIPAAVDTTAAPRGIRVDTAVAAGEATEAAVTDQVGSRPHPALGLTLSGYACTPCDTHCNCSPSYCPMSL